MSDSQPELDRRRQRTTISKGPSRYSGRLLLSGVAAATLATTIAVTINRIITQKGLRVTVHREAFNLLTQRVWGVLGFAVAVGVASAAAVQFAKQLLGVRSRFQQRWVVAWISERCAIEPLWAEWMEQHMRILAPDISPRVLAASQRKFAAEELEAVLLGGFAQQELQRVFDLPIEQLCAQIGSVADRAITQPHLYAELLLALTGPTGLDDIDSLAPPLTVDEDGRIYRTFQPDTSAYSLVAQGVRTGIDLMQISVGQRWRRGVRSSAVVICGIFATVGVLFAQITWSTRALFVLTALVLGGFFAWLVRDLTAIVERIRK